MTVELEEKEENVPRDAVGSVVVLQLANVDPWEIYTFHVTDARSYESETSCMMKVCMCLGRGAVWILHGPGFKTEVYFDA